MNCLEQDKTKVDSVSEELKVITGRLDYMRQEYSKITDSTTDYLKQENRWTYDLLVKKWVPDITEVPHKQNIKSFFNLTDAFETLLRIAFLVIDNTSPDVSTLPSSKVANKTKDDVLHKNIRKTISPVKKLNGKPSVTTSSNAEKSRRAPTTQKPSIKTQHTASFITGGTLNTGVMTTSAQTTKGGNAQVPPPPKQDTTSKENKYLTGLRNSIGILEREFKKINDKNRDKEELKRKLEAIKNSVTQLENKSVDEAKKYVYNNKQELRNLYKEMKQASAPKTSK